MSNEFKNPIVYTELQTTDPARAQAFYGELFGWKAEKEATPFGPYWMFQGQLAGMTAPRDGLPAGWIPYVGSNDVTTATRRARDLGAEVLRDCIAIPEGTFSVIKDPTGCVLGLFQSNRAQ
ncbi:MAG: VOC family protein [Deltaproteobacteria bacterium]|nr:VOC family protein [Deltaproteobacteria bacterium]